MDELKKLLASMATSIHVLGANTTANTRDLHKLAQDLQMMSERSRQTEEAVQNLQGTFASLEVHLVRLFELEAETQAWRQKMESRLEKLERRQPPAA